MLVGSNLTAATMAMAIGAFSPSNGMANLFASLAIMASVLFGGFMLNKDQIPAYCAWISRLSYFNYAYEALAVCL